MRQSTIEALIEDLDIEEKHKQDLREALQEDPDLISELFNNLIKLTVGIRNLKAFGLDLLALASEISKSIR